jgi:disease resistance protein RPS2
MLNLKVARECDQPVQEVHDLPRAMFGLESYVERLETLVTSKQSDADPQYVGVKGMGGVGKTLLLQRVYDNSKRHDHFRGAKFIWCTVGQTPDTMALYRTLSAKLGLEPEKTAIAEDYKHKLFNHFIQRRVFFVLDDVWEVKTFNSLDLARGKGSITLLSTRNQLLLDRNPHISQQYMIPLSKEDSWSLFCVHAFRPPFKVPSGLEPVARCIAEECRGLPLALKVVGGAMCGKVNVKYEWEPVLKTLRESRMQDRNVEDELYERLKLGYDLLSEDDDRLQQCFHYFAAFPEDFTIVFEEIVCHWIAEKLVPAHDGNDPTADAFSLLKTLWERSFIESNEQFNADESYVLTFKIHDVMRDLAFYLLEKGSGTLPAKQLYFYRAGQNLEQVPAACTAILEALRLSLHTNKLETIPDNFCAPKLKTLLLGRNPIISLPANFPNNFPQLTILNLRSGQIHNLPEEVGNLTNLVCLDLSDCHNLKNLPVSVRKLCKLKYLILDNCWSLNYLPSDITYLTSLQVLHTAHCESLTWMKQTSHLQPTIAAILEDICGLMHLTDLTIYSDMHRPPPDYELPQNICALTTLKLLQVSLNLRTLPFEMAYRCIHLQELEICSFELKYLPRSFTSCGAFPALLRLKLCFDRLREFPQVEKDALPKLRTLDLTCCQFLLTLPLSLERLTSLKTLILLHCNPNLKKNCRSNCEKAPLWRKFNIQFDSDLKTIDEQCRKFKFSPDITHGYINWLTAGRKDWFAKVDNWLLLMKQR